MRASAMVVPPLPRAALQPEPLAENYRDSYAVARGFPGASYEFT